MAVSSIIASLFNSLGPLFYGIKVTGEYCIPQLVAVLLNFSTAFHSEAMSRSSTKHGSLFRNALGPKQPPRGNVIPSSRVPPLSLPGVDST